MLYDPVRCLNVADTPEERVRQALLSQMLGPLAFPKALIAVEKKLKSSARRADIVAFAKYQDTLKPLVLIECKADFVDETTFQQAVGYNAKLAAPFLCLAHAGGIRTFWKEGGEVKTAGFLPPYQQLLLRFLAWQQ
ncbi:MAG: type I restriction enzyme HsdR N-terminal domain-containing protein [Verrucomicrobiota bacterium]|nr:type I restriction enzyme HsdR N-terminal domain-containing protein [Verrucomicrobiota bacterium]